jgi:hypothetical protein
MYDLNFEKLWVFVQEMIREFINHKTKKYKNDLNLLFYFHSLTFNF